MKFRETIPQEFVSHTVALCGTRGEHWLDALPALIEQIEKTWTIAVGPPFPSIEFNYVARATDFRGMPAVLKIAPPLNDSEIFPEAKFLRTAKGGGAVRLLAEDRQSRAILIERAEPGAGLVDVFANEPMKAIDPAIKVLKLITMEPPDDNTDVIKLDDWFDGLGRYPETAFPIRYGEMALQIYEDLARGQASQYLHGDFHPANIVSAEREPFLAIDPKGIVGPVGYDIAVFLNNFHWWQEILPDMRERLDIAVGKFANAFGISTKDLRRWAFAQVVLSAWWTFDEMPKLYNNEVAKADIWDI
jgi:streptomycin 6-kinase